MPLLLLEDTMSESLLNDQASNRPVPSIRYRALRRAVKRAANAAMRCDDAAAAANEAIAALLPS